MNTRDKGEFAKLKVMLRAAELGVTVSIPTTEVRYDMLLDWNGRFYRAQVKYADGQPGHAAGSVRLVLYRRGKNYLIDEIDVLLVYVPKIDRICWLGPEVFHDKQVVQIRYEPTKSGQVDGCLMAQDHLW